MQANPEQVELVQTGQGEPPVTPAPSNHLMSTFLIGFGSILLLFTITRILGKTRRRMRGKPVEDAQQTIQRHRAAAHAGREPLENVMAEANELALRLAKTLDAKAARLEILIEQADQRIAQLAANAYQTPSPNPAPQSQALAAATSLERQVLELSDKGCDSDQIARRVGRSVGEVELILALRR